MRKMRTVRRKGQFARIIDHGRSPIVVATGREEEEGSSSVVAGPETD